MARVATPVFTPRYGDTILPLVEGGSLYLWIGSDSVAIILSYCDQTIHRFVDLHRIPTRNTLLIDYLISNYGASAPPPSWRDDFVYRLEQHLDAVLDLNQSTALGTPHRPRDSASILKSLAHSRDLFAALQSKLHAQQSRIQELEACERFRCVLHDFVDGTLPSLSQPPPRGSDVDEAVRRAFLTPQAVARALPAITNMRVSDTVLLPDRSNDAPDADSILSAFHAIDMYVQPGTNDEWKPAVWEKDGRCTLFNRFQAIIFFAAGNDETVLAPVRVNLVCSSTSQRHNTEYNTVTLNRFLYEFNVHALCHNTDRYGSDISGSGQHASRMALFACRRFGGEVTPDGQFEELDSRPPALDPNDARTATWAYYRNRSETALRIDDWKRGTAPEPPDSAQPFRSEDFHWRGDQLIAAPAVSSDAVAAARVYALLTADQWVNLLLLLSSCAAPAGVEWRTAFRTLASHTRTRTPAFDEHNQ